MKKFQLNKNQNVSHEGAPVVRVNDVKSAKRLLSRLITEFQRGEIDVNNAKCLAYLLTVFVSISKDFDMETRLTELETEINTKFTGVRNVSQY